MNTNQECHCRPRRLRGPWNTHWRAKELIPWLVNCRILNKSNVPDPFWSRTLTSYNTLLCYMSCTALLPSTSSSPGLKMHCPVHDTVTAILLKSVSRKTWKALRHPRFVNLPQSKLLTVGRRLLPAMHCNGFVHISTGSRCFVTTRQILISCPWLPDYRDTHSITYLQRSISCLIFQLRNLSF